MRSTWTANAGVDCSGSTCDWGQIRIHDYKGALVASIALPAPGGASQKWNGILGSLTLDDVDGNGLLGELVIARRLLFFVFVCVCVLTSGADVFGVTANSRMVRYEIADSTGFRVLWATGRGSFQRNGQAPGENTATLLIYWL